MLVKITDEALGDSARFRRSAIACALVLFAPVAAFALVSFFAGLNERSFESSALFAVFLLVLPLDWALGRVAALKFWDRYSAKYWTAGWRETFAQAFLFSMLLSLGEIDTTESYGAIAANYVMNSLGYGLLFVAVSIGFQSVRDFFLNRASKR